MSDCDDCAYWASVRAVAGYGPTKCLTHTPVADAPPDRPRFILTGYTRGTFTAPPEGWAG